MRRKLILLFAAAFLLLVGFVVLKLTVPFSYAQAELRQPALEFVSGLQDGDTISPVECAARYLYFNSDYHAETPSRIEIMTKELTGDRVRVRLYDPSCHDDSIHSSIHRIYLERSHNKNWIPYRHEWSHTGRGRFGWTTQPTN